MEPILKTEGYIPVSNAFLHVNRKSFHCIPLTECVISLNILSLLFPDHYDNLEENYDKFYQPFHSGILEKCLEHLKLEPDDRLVDVGGGTGALAETMSKRAGYRAI